MKKIILLALVMVGCGDMSTTADPSGPCIDGYEQRDYYPRDAVWCGPVGNDAGMGATVNPCRGGRPVSFAGQGVVMCEFD